MTNKTFTMSNDVNRLVDQISLYGSASILIHTGHSYHVVWASYSYDELTIWLSHDSYNFVLSDIKSYCILDLE